MVRVIDPVIHSLWSVSIDDVYPRPYGFHLEFIANRDIVWSQKLVYLAL